MKKTTPNRTDHPGAPRQFHTRRFSPRSFRRSLILSVLALLLVAAPSASAKEVIGYFGSETGTGTQGGEFTIPGNIAVNSTGAGPADQGDVYVVDKGFFNQSGGRIQRFHHDDNGTAADPYDDSYPFVSAWGTDVVQPGGAGDLGDAATADYEICTVAAQCQLGSVKSGGNGTAAGNGSVDLPEGIAVDQDTGDVYVSDNVNARVNVYDGAGSFLRSFGYDVVQSGPDDNGTGYERCVAANGDICKAGVRGTGPGQIGGALSSGASGAYEITVSQPDGNPASGTVFLADEENNRVDTYGLDGSSPASIGSATHFDRDSPRRLAVDSRGILYANSRTASTDAVDINRYDTEDANGGGVGFLTPIFSETIRLTGGPGAPTSSNPYRARFTGLLGAKDVEQLTVANGATPLTGGDGISATVGPNSKESNEETIVTVNAASGQFRLSPITVYAEISIPAKGSSTATINKYRLGAFHVGDTVSCSGEPIGTVTAVDSSTVTFSEPLSTAGFCFGRETTPDIPYNAPPTGAGSAQEALTALPGAGPTAFTVAGGPGDAIGSSPYRIRYSGPLAEKFVPDSIDAFPGATPLAGGSRASVATLTPGSTESDEEQWVTVNASAGQFRLSFEGQTTGDLPYNASAAEVAAALRSLSSVPAAPLPNSEVKGLAVDPGDDALYVFSYSPEREAVVRQFGPVNPPGLLAPPTVEDQDHGSQAGLSFINGLALDTASGSLYLSNTVNSTPLNDPPQRAGVYVLGPAGAAPTITLDSIDEVTSSAASVHATIDPNGGPDVSYRLEYSLDGSNWTELPKVLVGRQETPQPIDVDLDPPGGGLLPDTLYHVRIAALKAFAPPVFSSAQTFTTAPSPPLVETVGSPVRTATTARLEARVNPRGSDTSYHFDYLTDAQFQQGGFAAAASTPETPLPGLDETQTVTFQNTTKGQFRLKLGTQTTGLLGFESSAAKVQEALQALSSVGTGGVNVTLATGGPTRTYRFAFAGPLAGTDVATLLVLPGLVPFNGTASVTTPQQGGPPPDRDLHASAQLSGLQPDTTYRYRVVADNGNSGSPVDGGDVSVRTRASDAPLTHGAFPGPPGSDRAWEQVSIPDTSGNPVDQIERIASDGNRAIYKVTGGLSVGDVGSGAPFFARRTPTGWQTEAVLPPRTELAGRNLVVGASTDDLSSFLLKSSAATFDPVKGSYTLFRITPDQPQPFHALFSWTANPDASFPDGGIVASGDLSRVLWHLEGHAQPSYGNGGPFQLYDVSSGAPELASLLPGGAIPACGEGQQNGATSAPPLSELSPDGSLLYMVSEGQCSGTFQLYLRDLLAGTTTLVSQPLSGPACRVGLIKSDTAGDAVYFWTQSRLVAEDSNPSACGQSGGVSPDGDVYRYDIGAESLKCLTCVIPGLDADVLVDLGTEGRSARDSIAVAGDGSRLYFTTRTHLLPGAPPDGQWAIYRLDLTSETLAFVAGPFAGSEAVEAVKDARISSNGAFLVFLSGNPSLNLLTSADNGGTRQIYLYHDTDRSLVCASCPLDGRAPLRNQTAENNGFSGLSSKGTVADDGTVPFTTFTPLLGADQNTPGPGQDTEPGADIYEWRDGRQLLVTDGLTHFFSIPTVSGITPSGRDLFFTAPARYTPDAPDSIRRAYDARIGGGFEFPAGPQPCPLEVCQGTPQGTPEEQPPGTSDYRGPGNPPREARRSCPRGKRQVGRKGKVRCVKPHKKRHHKRRNAHANRRAQR